MDRVTLVARNPYLSKKICNEQIKWPQYLFRFGAHLAVINFSRYALVQLSKEKKKKLCFGSCFANVFLPHFKLIISCAQLLNLINISYGELMQSIIGNICEEKI